MQVVPVDTGFPSSSTRSTWSKSQVSAFAFLLIGAYRGQPACAVESAPEIGRARARLLGHLADRLVELVVGDLDVLGVGQRPQGEVQANGPSGVGPDLAEQTRPRSRPDACRNCSTVRWRCLEAVPEIVQPFTHLLVDEGLGGLSSATRPTSASTVRSRRASWAWTTLSLTQPTPQVVAQGLEACRTPTPPMPTRRWARGGPSP